MTAPRDFADYLHDMLEATGKVAEFVLGMTQEQFVADEKTQYAVVRGLERSKIAVCTAALGLATGRRARLLGKGISAPSSKRCSRMAVSTSAALKAHSSGVAPSVKASSMSANCTTKLPPSCASSVSAPAPSAAVVLFSSW